MLKDNTAIAMKIINSYSHALKHYDSVLLDDYLQAELTDGARVVVASEHSVAVVPYWAVWPFETLLLPRRVVAAPTELGVDEVADLAATLGKVLATRFLQAMTTSSNDAGTIENKFLRQVFGREE